MSFAKIKLLWASRLVKSRFFIFMNEKESVMFLDGADPRSMNDQVALTAQAAEIDQYVSDLQELQKQHTKALKKFN